MDRRMDGWTNGRWMDGGTGGWMDRMDGWEGGGNKQCDPSPPPHNTVVLLRLKKDGICMLNSQMTTYVDKERNKRVRPPPPC